MTRRAPTLMAALLLLCTAPATAQIHDDFQDGDLTTDPPWSGETSRWTIDGDGSSWRLRSAGVAGRDTIHIATPSAVSYGRWAFSFEHQGVNLSSFNGARVYLVADTAALEGHVHGYYVQFGTNNGDEIRLYRQDGDPATRRVELGRSPVMLSGDSNRVDVVVTRSPEHVWVLSADGEPLYSAVDSTYARSRYVGLWVKHTEQGRNAFFFDDVAVTGTSAPPDRTPPVLRSVAYDPTENTLTLTFSEALDPSTVVPSAFELVGTGAPARVEVAPSRPAVVVLHMAVPLSNGTHTLALGGVADEAGNRVPPGTTFDFAVDVDRTPPAVLGVIAEAARRVLVRFDEAIRVEDCSPARFDISPGIGMPERAACRPDPPGDVVLHLAQALATGAYTLVVRGVRDTTGNVLAEARADFVYADRLPGPGEVVVNEIMYDPPADGVEYVEVYNRSPYTLDLSGIAFADDRRDPVPASPVPVLLPPSGYAVLAADSVGFRRRFPDVPFVVPAAWPALNNGGDAVVLLTGDVEIDAVRYDPAWGGGGRALERIDPGGPSDSRRNFASSTADAGGTPGRRNSRYAPDRTPPFVVFADEVDSTTVAVFFSEPLDPTSLEAADLTVDARAATGLAAVADTVYHVAFPGIPGGSLLRVSGVRDRSGNEQDGHTITIARRGAPGTVVVNEILFDPRADRFDQRPDQPEFVEFYNGADDPVSLRGWVVSQRPDERGRADTLHVGRLRSLPPGGFAVLFAAGNPPDSTALARAFPERDPADAAVLLPFAGTSLRLDNSGDVVRLHRRDGVVLDSVQYDERWHHASLQDATGVSLERIAPDGPPGASNWTSSTAPAGATPGRHNSTRTRAPVEAEPPGLSISPSPFSVERDGVTIIRYMLSTDTSLLRARIFDSRGRHVRTLEAAGLAGRTGVLHWDGLDDAGRRLRIGVYVVLVEAVDAEGGTAEAFKEAVVLARPLD